MKAGEMRADISRRFKSPKASPGTRPRLISDSTPSGFTVPAVSNSNFMSVFTAVMIAEGVQSATEAEQIKAWQKLIDTGVAWQLQGSFGRQAKRMIEEGVCHE